MRIEVSQLPPVEYSPNWRGHWAQRYKAGIAYSEAVYCECVQVRNSGNWQPFKRARLALTFVFPYKRRFDEDNLRARFKPGQDTLVHAGLIEGDTMENLELGTIQCVVDKARAPLTIIELEEVTSSD
ncbi:hypothetical protein ES703_32154 [subsurface metagenome]